MDLQNNYTEMFNLQQHHKLHITGYALHLSPCGSQSEMKSSQAIWTFVIFQSRWMLILMLFFFYFTDRSHEGQARKNPTEHWKSKNNKGENRMLQVRREMWAQASSQRWYDKDLSSLRCIWSICFQMNISFCCFINHGVFVDFRFVFCDHAHFFGGGDGWGGNQKS